MKRIGVLFAIGLFSLCLAGEALGAPVAIRLPFTTKVPLPVGVRYVFRFGLYEDQAASLPVYTETQTIKLTSPTLRFNLGVGVLEPGSPALDSVDFSQQLWLKIERSKGTRFVAVGNPAMLTIVPYALWSSQVEGGTGNGTVTFVGTGSGLAGGPITSSGTISIPTGGVNSGHVSDGTVAPVDVNFNYAGSTSKGGSANDADKVDGRHAISLRPIVATSTPGAGALGASCSNHMQVSITAPVAGTIVVDANVGYWIDHKTIFPLPMPSDSATFNIGLSASDCNSAPSVVVDVIAAMPAGVYRNSVHLTGAFTVAAGTHTYYVNGLMMSGASLPGDNYLGNSRAVAIFYPN